MSSFKTIHEEEAESIQRTLQDEITRLRAELAAKSKDAARYAWLRDTPWYDNVEVAPVIQMQMNSLWDRTIDAEIEKGEGNGR